MRTFRRRLGAIVLLASCALVIASALGGFGARGVSADPAIASPSLARVYFSDEATLRDLAARVDIWEAHRSEGYVLALLRPTEYDRLTAQGLRVEVDTERTAQLSLPQRALEGQSSGIPGYACYRTVEEMYSSMEGLAADHPELATWGVIGYSWDWVTPGGPPGYPLNVLVLTNRANNVEKARLFVMAETHAREYATAEMAARFAEYLVAHYGRDADVTWLLDYNEVHIVPMANPDGRKMAEQGVLWRKNTNSTHACKAPYGGGYHYGVDLNRNSSFLWDLPFGASDEPCEETYRGASAASEPETQAIEAYVRTLFADQRGDDLSDPAPANATGLFITLHSYGNQVLYPWGWTDEAAPNESQLRALGRKFGFLNGYDVLQASGLYPTSGATDDWAYGELGVPSYTFEMGTQFFQGCGVFEEAVVPDNMAALIYAVKAVRRPYQTPLGPDSTAVSLSSSAVTPGTVVTLTATADDTRYWSGGYGEEPTQTIQAVRYFVDAPPWAPGASPIAMSPVDGAFDSPVEVVSAAIDTRDWALGRHTIFVESQDTTGMWGVPTATSLMVGRLVYLPVVSREAAQP